MTEVLQSARVVCGRWLVRDRDVVVRYVRLIRCECQKHCGEPVPVIPLMSQLCTLLTRDRGIADVTWDGKNWCPTVTRN